NSSSIYCYIFTKICFKWIIKWISQGL
ncbi:uncharacterized protein METZ01_LOCUS433347, partial [marine metagenome]